MTRDKTSRQWEKTNSNGAKSKRFLIETPVSIEATRFSLESKCGELNVCPGVFTRYRGDALTCYHGCVNCAPARRYPLPVIAPAGAWVRAGSNLESECEEQAQKPLFCPAAFFIRNALADVLPSIRSEGCQLLPFDEICVCARKTTPFPSALHFSCGVWKFSFQSAIHGQRTSLLPHS